MLTEGYFEPKNVLIEINIANFNFGNLKTQGGVSIFQKIRLSWANWELGVNLSLEEYLGGLRAWEGGAVVEIQHSSASARASGRLAELGKTFSFAFTMQIWLFRGLSKGDRCHYNVLNFNFSFFVLPPKMMKISYFNLKIIFMSN